MENNKKVDILNNTWKPLLAFLIDLSVFVIYVLYPLIHIGVMELGKNITMPSFIYDNINALLLTGGLLAGLRTVQKKINAIDDKIIGNSSIEKFLVSFNKYWRPVLAYTVIISVLIGYVLNPVIGMFLGEKYIHIDNYYSHLNTLLLTGGLLAGLKAYELKTNISSLH